ncbi:hypothetical protein K6Y31_12950 [Motilimonas cestriensis]|uniref:Transmembrane protein n=1 Tax=Motilimonas cestriensis TaxID=2742685 RepID=A0ABS8WDL5_9GAMM|nr:DUF6622 family protein [Motilimonas cestriensis]MCE2595721.1 hypothetical protein [Motilimonas cestriensis]
MLFLIVLGIQQSKDRKVRKYLILPLPIGMALLSYLGVQSSFGLAWLPVGLWFLALVLIAYSVAKYFPVKKVQFNADLASFIIPGSWIPLVLMMAIFFTKYFVGVLNALQPTIVSDPTFIVVCSIIYGSFSGLFVARAFSMWRAIDSVAAK